MSTRWKEFRTLDKDLSRLSAAERAGQVAARPVMKLGLAVLFIAAVVLVSFGMMAGRPGLAMAAAGGAVAAYLAMSIGANDVANSMGPAVGAGALTPGMALVLAAMAEIAGAWFAGHPVSERLANGIISGEAMQTTAAARVMLAALLAAGIWINFATWAGAPVSTTHSIVGGIAGAGIAAFGIAAVHWQVVAMIAASWMISPVMAGGIAALMLAFIRAHIHRAPDRIGAARRWLPVLLALMAGVFALYLAVVALHQPRNAVIVALAAAVCVWLWAHRKLTRALREWQPEKQALQSLFVLPLAMGAVLVSFAHGANDVANIAAPLKVIVQHTGMGAGAPKWVVLTAALGIALGVLLFGRRLVRMVGSGITRLNPIRAFCVTVATAVTVLTASAAGLPVSTTYVAVGGVFGVGFFREWDDRRQRKARAALPVEERQRRHLVRRSHFATILSAWIVTVPLTGGLSAVLFQLLGPLG